MPRILFPTGGVSTRYAVQNQPPFTTAEAMNVRPDDSIAGRERGGSRRGLDKDYKLTRVAATVSGSAVYSAPSSTITVTTTVLDATMVGGLFTFDTTLDSFTILSVTSTTILVVSGDASVATGGQTSGDTCSISGGELPLPMGSGSSVKMISSVRSVYGLGPSKFIQDDFTNEDGGTPETDYWDNSVDTELWTAGRGPNLTVNTSNDWLQNADVTQGDSSLVMIASGGAGAFLGTSDINALVPFKVSFTPANTDATYKALRYRAFRVHAFMDNDDPNPYTDGITVSFNCAPGDSTNSTAAKVNASVISRTSGVATNWGSKTRYVPYEEIPTFSVEFIMQRDSTRSPVSILIRRNESDLIWKADSRWDGSSAFSVQGGYRRIGISLGKSGSDSDPDVKPAISSWSVQYASKTHETLPPEMLVCASSSAVYREEYSLGGMRTIGTNSANGIEMTDAVSACQRLGKLYIADYDLVVDETDTTAATIDTADDKLTHAGKNFTNLGVTTVDRVDITSASDTSILGTYAISAVGTTTITLAGYTGGSASSVSYRICCGPKVYDASTDILSQWHDTVGDIPIGCNIVSTYADRMLLTGDPLNPGVIFMSREGDPDDWDFSVSDTDAQRPVGLGSTDSDVGGLPEAVTACIPHSDDYMIFGSKNTLWVLAGDPSLGGSLDNLSYTVGVIGRFAWCKAPDNTLFFLSKNGIYYMPAGVTMMPQPVSKQSIPQSLLSVDTQVVEPFLAYSLEEDGIYIFLSAKDKRSMQAFFMDVQTGGFFPLLYSDQNHHPASLYIYQPESLAFTKLLLGGKDGYIRTITDSGDDDAGVIASSVTLGPLSLGTPGGFLEWLHAHLGVGSGDVNWELVVGESAEALKHAPVIDSGTWTASSTSGSNYYNRPQVRGAYCALRLYSTEKWAMEFIDFERRAARGHMPL